ncbi:hypothetical protein WP50_39050, partial [Lactiplantibacillus plantarum]
MLNNNRLPINDRLKSTRDFNRLFIGNLLLFTHRGVAYNQPGTLTHLTLLSVAAVYVPVVASTFNDYTWCR